MTKQTMIRNYRKYSVADSYIIGFVHGGMVYFTEVKEIAPRFLNVEEASRNQGSNLRLRIKAQYRNQLVKKAICLGSADILTESKYNKGEIFEKYITEFFGQVWEKDTVPFYKDGDITVDGRKIQIKLDSATLTNTKQLAKLKRGTSPYRRAADEIASWLDL